MMLAMRGLAAAGAVALGALGLSVTPADIYAELKGITQEQALELRQESRESFTEMAYDEGGTFWEEYKADLIESRSAALEERVADGDITQAQMDAMVENMTERLDNYDPENPVYGGGCGMGGAGRGARLGGRGSMMSGLGCRGAGTCLDSDDLDQ